jgi:hypothetical protein
MACIPVRFSHEGQPMDVEEARIHCQRYVESGMLRHHARNALQREGFDEWTVEEVLADYESMRQAHRSRLRRFTQAWGTALFVGCSGVFVYFAFFASPDWHILHWWLLGPAMFGLLKMLLP